MEIVIKDLKNEYIETVSFENLDNSYETFKKFSSIKGPLKANIFIIKDSIGSYQLSKFKKNLEKINIRSFSIYSNNRETILAESL